jgi:hypothetical protein
MNTGLGVTLVAAYKLAESISGNRERPRNVAAGKPLATGQYRMYAVGDLVLVRMPQKP